MKKIKTILFLTSIFLLAGCGNTTNPNDITAIEIAGPYSVLQGKTITLIADVIGTEDDSVTWTSENEEIATVNQYGVVTGINEGVVNIIATSTLNPEISASYEVSVTLLKADSISLVVEDNDLIEQKSADTYNVPIGLVFTVDVSTKPITAKQPENLSLEVKYPSESEVNQSTAFTAEIVNDKQIKVRTLESENNIILVVKAIYADMGTQALTSSLTFNVIDNNVENVNTVQSLINEFKTVEETSLIGSTVNTTKIVKESGNYTKTVSTTNVKSFEDASYASNVTKVYNDENSSTFVEQTNNYYNGVYDNTHYSFAYDNDKHLTTLYKNQVYTSGKNHSVYFENRYDGIVYGHNGILGNILSGYSYIDTDIVTIANTYAYPYANFVLTDNQYTITSKYYDDDKDLNYELELVILRDKTNVISGYTYEVKASNEYKEISYLETVSFDTFGAKTLDTVSSNDKHLDIRIYYFESFELVELAGTKAENGEYDYTNLSKFGSDKVVVTDNVKTYYLTYDKVLVLGITNNSPSTSNTLIDYIMGESSDTEQISNVTMTGDGVFTIAPNKDDDGKSLPGEAFFTFKSKSAFEVKIKVVFTKTVLKGLNFNTPNYDSQDWGEIFVGDKTKYFFLNTNPDEDGYKFVIDIISGEKDGIELFKYENGNLEGIPGFAYAVLAKKVGNYTFRFYVDGYDYAYSDTFTLKVKDSYEVSYLKQKLVASNVSFRYFTGTMEVLLKFISDTTLRLIQTNLGEESKTQDLSYHFEKGRIIIEPNQKFVEGFYFTSVAKDGVSFDGSLSNISIYLSSDEIQKENKTYSKVTFKKVVNSENFGDIINDSVYEIEEFVSGFGMAKIKLTFKNGNGSFVAKALETGETIVNITFTYSYDSNASQINISNIEGDLTKYYLSRTYIEVDLYNYRLVVYFYSMYSEEKYYFAF